MSSNWKPTTWGELATIEYGKGLIGYEESNGNYPVYGTNGRIGSHTKALFNKAGVIIGRKGAYRGIHYSKTPFYVIDTAFYLKPKNEFDLRWAYYQLLTQDINSMDSGSAIPSTSRPDFYALPVLLPPLPEQRAIAGMLGALDDKIEVNRRMNATLETMAQMVFRQRFVEGNEANEWEEKNLEDITIRITKGTTPTTLGYQFTDSGINFVKVNSITDNHQFIIESFDFIDEKTHGLLSRSILEKDDILLTIAGTIGRLAKVPDYILPANTNQAVAIIRPEKSQVLPNYIRMWLCLEDVRQELFANVVHAVQPNLSLGMISKAKIKLPKYARLAELFEPIDLLLNKIEINVIESRTLGSLRDSLLPKLMRGEVRVNP